MNIDKNRDYWGNEYEWKNQGEEWSESWGCSKSQWFSSILPRIQKYLPCNTILEIACGYGRWTNFLKDYCGHLYAIDLAEECIQVSTSRFKDNDHIEFFVNDGKSLDMIVSSSIDFDFIFECEPLVQHTQRQLLLILAPHTSFFRPQETQQNREQFPIHSFGCFTSNHSHTRR